MLVNISKEMWPEQKAGARFWSVWCFSGVFIAVAMGTAQLLQDVRMKSGKSLLSPFGSKIKIIFGGFSEGLCCDGIFREAQKLPTLLGLLMAQSQEEGGFS